MKEFNISKFHVTLDRRSCIDGDKYSSPGYKKVWFYCSYQNQGDHDLFRIQGEGKDLFAENHFDKSVHKLMINEVTKKIEEVIL